MNKKLFLSIFFLMIGLIALMYARRSTIDVKPKTADHDKINLAMRQAVHKLLILGGDSTSVIPMVNKSSENEYELYVNQKFNYDFLPEALDEALRSYEIEQPYIVKLFACDSDSLMLGYNYLALVKDQVACQGRENNIECSRLRLELLEHEVAQSDWMKWFALTSMAVGLILLLLNLFWSKKSEKQLDESIKAEGTFALGSLIIDCPNQKVTGNGEEISLTFRENKLLQYLVERRGTVLPREDILKHVWEDEGVIVGRSLDVFISRLRKILKLDPRIEIKSIHGVGYKLIESK